MSSFGENSPQDMRWHYFSGTTKRSYDTAMRSDPSKQNCSVCPRYWYLDVDYTCAGCGNAFTWTAKEQKVWFEDYGFWVDSEPNHCKGCRRLHRYFKEIRNEYDSIVASARSNTSFDGRRRIIEIVDELEKSLSDLPQKMIDTRTEFRKSVLG